MLHQINSRHSSFSREAVMLPDTVDVEKMKKIAVDLLREANIRPVSVVEEEISDEADTWLSVTYYLDCTFNKMMELDFELGDRISELPYAITGNVVVMYCSAR